MGEHRLSLEVCVYGVVLGISSWILKLGRPSGEREESGDSPFEKGGEGLPARSFDEDRSLSLRTEPAGFEKAKDGYLPAQDVCTKLLLSFGETASMNGRMIDAL